jgi:hypothetical protein
MVQLAAAELVAAAGIDHQQQPLAFEPAQAKRAAAGQLELGIGHRPGFEQARRSSCGAQAARRKKSRTT